MGRDRHVNIRSVLVTAVVLGSCTLLYLLFRPGHLGDASPETSFSDGREATSSRRASPDDRAHLADTTGPPSTQAPSAPVSASRPNTASRLAPEGRPSSRALDQIRLYAVRIARELWGPEARAYDERVIYGPEARPTSCAFVFTLGGSHTSREDLLARLLAGESPTVWDESFRGIEMGMSSELPPVICYWKGLPAEYVLLPRAFSAIEESFGDGPYRLERIHLSAVFPIFEFTGGSRSYFYETRSSTASDTLTIADNEEYRGSEAHRKKVERCRLQWARLEERLR